MKERTKQSHPNSHLLYLFMHRQTRTDKTHSRQPKTDRQTDRHRDTYSDRHTIRHTDTYTDRHTDRHRYTRTRTHARARANTHKRIDSQMDKGSSR